ncbi:hypothetical protein GF318_06300 [Candidatus Micrarchaeota archaeon]|nr:hypothetical protein [Candidatus Micrarchaeota archaeon]
MAEKKKMKGSMITEFYKSLAKGKIYGVQCSKCGFFDFPPKTACKECGYHDMKLRKISGDGELLFFSSGNLPPKKFAKYHPYAYGAVELKEGPTFFTQIEGLDVSSVKRIQEQNEKMPMKVKAKVKKMAGMNIVIFRVVK